MDARDLHRLGVCYASSKNISLATVSNLACGNATLFKRISHGGSCTIRTFNKVLQWFSDNWPADLFWPLETRRPGPSPDSPAAQALAAAAPTTDLNANGEIANLADWCRRNAYELYDARSVIRNYGVGGPREGRYPRRNSSAQFVLDQLIKTGDRRFATYHRYDQIAQRVGL